MCSCVHWGCKDLHGQMSLPSPPPSLVLSIVLGTNERIFHIWVITHQSLWLENRTPRHLTL